MRRFLYGALGTAVAGCGFSNATEGDGGPPPPDACVTYSAQLDTCKLPMGPALELSGMLEMNTTTGALIDKVTGVTITITTMSVGTLEAPVQAILAERVTFAPNTTLRAIGPRGLAIVSSHSITLGANALIDVSNNGAGARLSVCDPRGPTKGENDAGGAGGGGGAGFGGAGGKGGDGNGDDVVGNRSAGGDPGIAVEAPLGPRGGCPGAPGGDGDEPGGPGGRGGGAVWLAAGHTIALAAGAGINAGGGGGSGGTRVTSQGDAGGGGGGSGGVI
ncbi:MAG TPA: hypothetical protein VK427_16210, partial [Kofleriaceae bacterium]|nr:hypothetical protein [Kofleriaceae bacterium]